MVYVFDLLTNAVDLLCKARDSLGRCGHAYGEGTLEFVHPSFRHINPVLQFAVLTGEFFALPHKTFVPSAFALTVSGLAKGFVVCFFMIVTKCLLNAGPLARGVGGGLGRGIQRSAETLDFLVYGYSSVREFSLQWSQCLL